MKQKGSDKPIVPAETAGGGKEKVASPGLGFTQRPPSSSKAENAPNEVPVVVVVNSAGQTAKDVAEEPANPSTIIIGVPNSRPDEALSNIPKKVKKPIDLRPGQIFYNEDRQKWENSYNCMLSMVGFAVGLSNIWRFPYLCFEYGGGNFMIPYFIFLFICAIPVMYLEVIVGQFTQAGMISMWKLVPICRGIGMCQTILPFLIAFYYHTILAWSLLYCVEALFNHKVPWVGCSHPWNTLHCRDIPPDFEQIVVKDNELRAGAEFFRGRVQRKWKSMYVPKDNITSRRGNGVNGTYGLGADDMGINNPNTDVSLYLLAIYICMLILLSRGLRVKGAPIWMSIISPYIMMLVLLYRGLSLPGAWQGVKFLFDTNNSKIYSFKTWRVAAEQTLFSCGAGTGIHLTFASHSKFNHNMLSDAVGTALINVLTSMICAVIVFMCLGNIAFSDSIDIKELIAQGPELVFEVCADALGRLPGANFYSFIFFLMILVLGFESSHGALICALESCFDVCGEWFDRNGNSRGIFVKVMLCIAYVVGLLCATRGGLHMFIFLDKFTAVEPLLLCAFLLVFCLTWIWGLHEICDAAEIMIGNRPNAYFQVCWKFISPAVIFSILIMSEVETTKAEYADGVGNNTKIIKFSDSLQTTGVIYSHSPDSLILIGVLWYWCSSPGRTFKEKCLLAISPEHEHEEIMETGTSKRTALKHYLYCSDVPKLIVFLRKSRGVVYPIRDSERDGDLDAPVIVVSNVVVPIAKPERKTPVSREVIPEIDDDENSDLHFDGSNESFRTLVHKLSL